MNREPFQPLRRLRNASITTKLIGIVTVFLIAIIGVLTVGWLALNVSAGVRAYVTGEGIWTKAQKEAVYALSRYIHTREEADYQRYTQAIAIPLGDRKARIELAKPDFDRAVATQGFMEGGNTPEDVQSLIQLYRRYHDVGFIATSIALWDEGDRYNDKLIALAEQVRKRIAERSMDDRGAREFLDQVDVINTALTPLEAQFSQTLSKGARGVQSLLLLLIVFSTAMLLTVGLYVSWLISRDLHASIDGLREGAIRVAQGDMAYRIQVRSRDELGDLTLVFNEMIARRHDAEVALTGATEFREKVMENATNAIYTMDTEACFTTANRRTCEITGYPIEELIGLPWANLVPKEYLPDLFERFSATMQGREPMLNYECPLIRKDGGMLTIMFSLTALSRDGVIFGVVGAAEDITARKRAESELKARADELARSNQELEQFAYVASHDLQEPLRTVSGFAQLLKKRYEGQLGAEADEYIHFVTTGAQRMKSLIEDLLAFSRVTREQRALQDVDMNRALQTALANVHGAIEGAGASVVREPLPTLRANERQMVQLFQNLIGNAVKFRKEAPPVVHISAERIEGEWQFTVRDNGIGISAKHAEQVFGLFQRLHGRDKYSGNGIGLTICKKIVGLHQGRIWVEPSEPGERGAVFRFTLGRSDAPYQLQNNAA